MGKLVLIRHGQSQWNLENRFTGWIDIPLSNQGRLEAKEAGRKIKDILFDAAFCSKLIRAVETLLLVLSQNQDQKTPIFVPESVKEREWGGHYQPNPSQEVPVYRALALNERYYGDLQGLNKLDSAKRWGTEQVQLWRRSYEQAPPGGESLKDTVDRVIPYLKENIYPHLFDNKNVLIAAHGNSLRAIVMILENMAAEKVAQLEIPTGIPLIYDAEKTGETLLWKRVN
ncbi:MAG: 2,3-bisphosphoglycerate-dependent phosphoglycerate mutase [Deltaproteobacteria bacterium]|nr:2,3-bisphosphoglycerate-dependent phosphoglycerate mutase [Deltaproteobacteria bacterium]